MLLLLMLLVVVMDMIHSRIGVNHNDVDEDQFHDMFEFVDEFHELVYMLIQMVNEL
jgi:hypothetical protein